jgi:hypothetical protein
VVLSASAYCSQRRACAVTDSNDRLTFIMQDCQRNTVAYGTTEPINITGGHGGRRGQDAGTQIQQSLPFAGSSEALNESPASSSNQQSGSTIRPPPSSHPNPPGSSFLVPQDADAVLACDDWFQQAGQCPFSAIPDLPVPGLEAGTGLLSLRQPQVKDTIPHSSSRTSTPPEDPELVMPIPHIQCILPTSGPVTGGTEIAILGTNFYRGLRCAFGGGAGVDTTWFSDTASKCHSPPGQIPGEVDVKFEGVLEMHPTATFTYIDTREKDL